MERLLHHVQDVGFRQGRSMEQQLCDWYEILQEWNLKDMGEEPAWYSEALGRLDERLQRSRAPQIRWLSVLSRMLTPALLDLMDHLGHRLKREHVQMPTQKARELDTKSLRWLGKQSGATLVEKAGQRQRILAVKREFSYNTPENRLILKLASDLHKQILLFERDQHFSEVSDSDKNLLKDLKNICKKWIDKGKALNISALNKIPAPTNLFRYHKNYKKVWLAHRSTDQREYRIARLAEHSGIYRPMLLKSLVDTSLLRCGLKSIAHPCHLPQEIMEDTLWEHREVTSLWTVQVGSSLQGVHIEVRHHNGEILKRYGQLLRIVNTCGQIDIEMLPLERFTTLPKEFSDLWQTPLEASWICCSNLVEGMTSFWKQLSDFPSGVISIGESACAENPLRVSLLRADALISWQGDNRTQRPLCGSLQIIYDSKDGESSHDLSLTGESARRAMLYNWPYQRKEIKKQNRIQSHKKKSHSLFQPFRFMARLGKLKGQHEIEILKHLMDSPSAILNEVVLIHPNIMSERDYQCLLNAQPNPDRTWMMPESVAMAFAYLDSRVRERETMEKDVPIFFIHLDAELIQPEYLQWHFLDEGSLSNGEWWRFRIQDFHLPSILSVAQSFFENAEWSRLDGHDEPIGFRRKVSTVLQLDISTLCKSFEREMTRVWIDPGCDSCGAFDIPKSCFQYALDLWIKKLKNSWGEWLQQWLKTVDEAPFSVILGGDLATLPGIIDAFSGLGHSVRVMASSEFNIGAQQFLNRKKNGLGTWRDYLPKLELKAQGRYLQILGKEKAPAPGDPPVCGEEFEFEVPSETRLVSIPMIKDGRAAKEFPVLTLREKKKEPFSIFIRAEYEVGKGGLKIHCRSEDGDILPPTVMQWGSLKGIANRDAGPFRENELSPQISSDEAICIITARLEKMKKCESIEQITQELKQINDILTKRIRTPERFVWEKMLEEEKQAWAQVVKCMTLISDNPEDHSLCSPLLPEVSWRNPWRGNKNSPLGKVKGKHGIQEGICRFWGALKAATPDEIVNRVRNHLLDIQQKPDRVDRPLFRLAGNLARGDDTSELKRIELIHLLLETLCHWTQEPFLDQVQQEDWRSLYEVLSTWLRGHQCAAREINRDFLRRGVLCAIDSLGKMDRSTVMNVAVSMLKFSYDVRYHASRWHPDFIPESDFALEVARRFQILEDTSGWEVELTNLESWPIKELDPEVICGNTWFGKMAEVWRGHSHTLLMPTILKDNL